MQYYCGIPNFIFILFFFCWQILRKEYFYVTKVSLLKKTRSFPSPTSEVQMRSQYLLMVRINLHSISADGHLVLITSLFFVLYFLKIRMKKMSFVLSGNYGQRIVCVARDQKEFPNKIVSRSIFIYIKRICTIEFFFCTIGHIKGSVFQCFAIT